MPRIYRKIAVIAAVFIVTGLLRAPWESSLESRLTAAGLLREPPPDIDWRQRLRQETLAALFGKFRPIMAIYWTLIGMEDWADKDWPGVEKNFRMATDLDPDDVDLWVFAIWMLETNAASYWIMREDKPETVREAKAMQWVLKGLGVADRSLQYHPESAKLLSQTAKVYHDKMKLPCEAAAYYKRARDGDSPLGFLTRFYPYALALCPGSEEEAFEILMELYREERTTVAGTTVHPHRVPTLIKRIKMLEEELNVPIADRIPDPDPDQELLDRIPNAKGALERLDLKNLEESAEVYLTLKYLYERGSEFRSPILVRSLKNLEEQLSIPAEQRISDEDTEG